MASFAAIVKSILQKLSPCDYPVPSLQNLVDIHFRPRINQYESLVLSPESCRFSVAMSIFSKANKTRNIQIFQQFFMQLAEQVRRKNSALGLLLFALDSTVISLTSKLFWSHGYHQVKLLSELSVAENIISDSVIRFEKRNDISFRESVIGMILENALAITDRGFAIWKFLDELSVANHLFIVRTKKNMKTKLNHNRYRVILFCDTESGEEFHLATNITFLSNKEISELYRKRWARENLWKFLKMHLSSDNPITKSESGVRIQIYMILMMCLILELVELPEIWWQKLIDKLKYVLLELSRRCPVVHSSFDWQPEICVT